MSSGSAKERGTADGGAPRRQGGICVRRNWRGGIKLIFRHSLAHWCHTRRNVLTRLWFSSYRKYVAIFVDAGINEESLISLVVIHQ